MYPLRCIWSKDGYHEITIEGTPRSAMTYWRCRICDGRWERGQGAFYGFPPIESKTLEERVRLLEKKLSADISSGLEK
jgi:hypothetical protein